jgi:anti-sigma factor RsiW
MTSDNRAFNDEQLQAYVDNELDEITACEVEKYLQLNPQLAEEINDYQQYNADLHRLFDPVLDEKIPERLQAKTAKPSKSPWFSYSQAASLFLAVAIGVIIGWMSRAELAPTVASVQQATNTLVQDAFAYHAVYTPEVLHPVEVDASQQQHLTKWLSKRLKTKIRAPDLAKLGFNLLGGRLLESGNEPAAQFMYENEHGQRLTLFARHRFNTENETAFHYASAGKINGFYWIDDQLSFVIVSAIPKAEISRVSHYVYQTLNS